MPRLLPPLCLAILCLIPMTATMATPQQTYDWHGVRIGGGGFVSGLLFHPKENGLAFARTDVGGAYRWDDKTAAWRPLTDWLGMDDVNLTGIESLAVDPSDPARIYLAAGTYTNPRVGNGAILASSNGGNTWSRCDLPFKLGANEAGRGNGERLAVDPNNGAILLFGSRSAGLWRSTDHGATWTQVTSFPSIAVSDKAGSGDRFNQRIGINFILFDPRGGSEGAVSSVIYAGVSTRETCLFRSTDGGNTWAPVPGQPVGLRPTRPSLASDGTLYLSYGDEPGPNSMKDGAVWKFDTRAGTWTDITPLRPSPSTNRFGYGAVAADPANPRHLLVSTFCRYKPDHDEIFRSTDGGATWRPVLEASDFDHTQSPWAGHHTPHWIADLRIDPFNPNHALFVTGYGVYRTRNLGDLDSGRPVHWLFDNTGLEETVPLALLSPPEGAPLLSALGDIDGFRHERLDTAGPAFAPSPRFANSEDIACAALKPSLIVRCGTIRERTTQVRIALSLDGGLSWKPLASEPADSNGAGRIDISADGAVIAWTPRARPPAGATGFDLWRPWPGQPCITRDAGASWIACKGLALGLQLTADRVDPSRFYAFDASSGTVFLSTDGGENFTAKATGLPSVQPGPGGFGGGPAAPGLLHAVPGLAGELWLETRGYGLHHSTDGGASFTSLASVEEAYSLGFGKAAPGSRHPALFLAGKIAGTKGLFRSDDNGATWLLLTDDRHRFGWINHVTGDPRRFGRVYFGTAGRGICYGDPR